MFLKKLPLEVRLIIDLIVSTPSTTRKSDAQTKSEKMLLAKVVGDLSVILSSKHKSIGIETERNLGKRFEYFFLRDFTMSTRIACCRRNRKFNFTIRNLCATK